MFCWKSIDFNALFSQKSFELVTLDFFFSDQMIKNNICSNGNNYLHEQAIIIRGELQEYTINCVVLIHICYWRHVQIWLGFSKDVGGDWDALKSLRSELVGQWRFESPKI